MSSLLAYGAGFLTGDIGSGAGLTEPWAQSFGWGDGGGSSLDQGPDLRSKEEGDGKGSDFFSLIQAGAPKDDTVQSPRLTRSSTKKELHWDSPPQSPSTVFVHLPYSVLQIVVTGTKADAVVVGLFQEKSKSVVETFLYLPKSLNFADYLDFKPDVLACFNGKVMPTDNLDLPVEFIKALGRRPQAFVAHRFPLEQYNGVFFALWRDAVPVPVTAEAVFADAVKSLPMLLSNRINARKYEHLGRRFDALLKVMPEAVVFVDDACAQVVINPAAAALLELPSHGEVDPCKIAIAMRRLTERCSTRTDPQHWMKLVTANEELEIEEDWELKMPRRVLHVRSYPVSSGAAHGRLWLYEDVTAERDAEEAIDAANRGKSQFLAMMSHELRTPMTGVLGMLDLLQLTSLVPEQQGLMKIMQESAEGLMEVINNILDFCKMEAGRLLLEEIDFSLNDTFEQIHTLSNKNLLEKGLKLETLGEPGAKDMVRGDPVRLRQILMNLVSNAIKFTDEGCITVSWRFLEPQSFDSTVVETSSSPLTRSEYINQIINASRKNQYSIVNTCNPSGRSVLTVDCSSPGAKPSAESGHVSRRFPLSPRPLDSRGQHRQSVYSSNDNKDGRARGMPQPSSPAYQSLNPKKRPASGMSQLHDSGLISNESNFSRGKATSSASSMLTSDSKVLDTKTFMEVESQAPLTQTPRSNDGALVSEGTLSRSVKYPRLGPVEELKTLQEASSASDRHRKGKSNLGSAMVCSADVSEVYSTNFSCQTTVESARHSAHSTLSKDCTGNGVISELESVESGDSCSTVATADATKVEQLRASHGQQFCEVCDGVIYDESKEQVECKPAEKVWLEVKVSDPGVGIAKEQLEKLFVASQAGSQRRDAAGTGLGLAICKGLLCLMGGNIQFDSKLGEGTIVTIIVPLLAGQEAVKVLMDDVTPVEKPTTVQALDSSSSSVKKTNPTVVKSTQVHVLVAEDNKVNQLLIRKMFRHYGHEVEVVGNGKLAVEAVQRKAFDVVLMDVQMPVLDGLSATKAIRALPTPTSRVPIYALSADTPGSGPMEETGLDGYLCKPIAWEKISGVVEKILAAKNSEL